MPATKSRNDVDGDPSPPSAREACIADMDSVDPQDIELGPIIGNGAFSTVFSATYKGERVALKRQAYGEHILRELSVLKQIDHPSLLRYIGSCEYNHQDSKEVWILSEFVGGGDVSKYLKGKKSPRLTWKETVQIALDAAEGLRYMHERHIIHRDIKAANMLLDDNLRIRLCDFGFAREVASDNENNAIQDDGPSPQSFQTHGRRMSLCGTDTYMPPEMLFEEDYNESADIFSYGVVLIELLCRRHINEDGFLKRQPAKNFAIDLDQFRSSVRPSCPPSLVLLAENCTAFEPSNRPTAREVCSNKNAAENKANADVVQVVEWLEDLQKDLNETRIYRRSSSSFGVPEGDDEASLSDSFASSAGLHPYDMDSGDDDCEPSAHLHENDEAHFDETSAPSYAGPLLMPHGHMHRWRQRWVVIQNSIVWIFKNQKQYQLHRQLTDEESYSDGKRSAKLPISTPLAGCVLKQVCLASSKCTWDGKCLS
ncbi:TKL/LISK/LISK-DD1 protein kinase, variant 2 [Aphanomyces invadans]|uniref:TKL/LISK/LISK-DD1 protein kinase, variant 2 n=1 Tax=Aphanomyces invadans TaxID=157072 RepID=A0A024US31_9STRA|nr:TKL/LISK/LISK-DD1 protein kinase, variant 2 [Aphanomyces invadans]ETW09134.1 TKL/LISK/LISK-DD1 protein kinase, variant 2 [Aphanomyces invadans]|eukprot:XP_008862942.1 TKL/LISK/LISK-DD1 protein kinase, variant 2 [Aphanomyces invadans]